jgi:hypothetical protein
MESAAVDLRSPELQLFDLLMPWNLGIGILGFLLAWAVVSVLERTGLTRFIWHLPLFFLALLVLITSLLGLVLHP